MEAEKNLIFHKTLSTALKDSLMSVNDSILVVCGGSYDRNILLSLGFKNVTISNLDSRMTGNEFEPYLWSYQDAEQISSEDDSFDWVLVHAGLHHCYSPHKALLEMIRVGRKGAIVFEARESFLMNLAMKFGLTPVYEIEPVIGHNFKHGGVANTHIPNFIYRWNEREVVKIISSYYPQYKNNLVRFFYNLRLPEGRVEFLKSPLKRMLMKMIFMPLKVFTFIFPSQSNEFGFIIKKGDQLQDWLIPGSDQPGLNMDYLKKHFDTTIRK